MKRIEYHKYGGPELMRLADFELAAPEKGEVAVKVKFAAINPIDWKLRAGQMKMVTGNAFPRAIGMDFSGTVISVGPGVTRFRPGDAVFGLARFKQTGSLAEAVIANEVAIAKKPDNISFEEAACMGSAGATAWNGLVDKANVKAGDRVFINGCMGSVGEGAVQIARMKGARIWGSCSQDAMERARSLGVETVLDYRTTDLSTIGERFDIVYDTSGKLPTSVGLGLSRKDGVFVDQEPSPGKFIRSFFNRRLKIVICTPRADIMDSIAQAAGEGKFRIPIGEIVPMEEGIRLLTELELGRKIGGKGVVAMEQPAAGQ